MKYCLLWILALLLATNDLIGQAPSLRPGSRIRVWTESNAKGGVRGSPVIGEITSWTEDSVVLALHRSPTLRVLAVESIVRLDVSRGQRTRGMGALRKGAAGLVVGGLTGVVLGLATGGDAAECSWVCFSAEDYAMIYGIMLGAPSALIGAVIGANRPGEAWQRHALPN